LRDDGSIFSWGSGTLGQLGDGTLVDRESPVTVLRAGAGQHRRQRLVLDLDPAIASTIPADKIPVFLVAAARAGSGIEANIQFRAQDLGNPIFVFGYVPASRFSAAKDGPRACSRSSPEWAADAGVGVGPAGLREQRDHDDGTSGHRALQPDRHLGRGRNVLRRERVHGYPVSKRGQHMCIVTVPAAAAHRLRTSGSAPAPRRRRVTRACGSRPTNQAGA